jgi:xanthosine utilization system XapX-like protein
MVSLQLIPLLFVIVQIRLYVPGALAVIAVVGELISAKVIPDAGFQ